MTKHVQLSLLDLPQRSFLLDGLVPKAGVTRFSRGQLASGRTIYIPNAVMEELQLRLLSWLTSLRKWMPHAHGGVAGRSPVTNARAHRGARYFYTTDLKSAFEVVSVEQMAEVLRSYSWHLRAVPFEWTQSWLEEHCFVPGGGLYTGGAASPMLFNMYITRRLSSALATFGTFTHYLDDIVISRTDRRLFPIERRRIREAVWRAGFELVDHKTRIDLDIHKGPIEITGVSLDRNGRMFPSKRRRTRANGFIAAALSGKVERDVALGHVGACLAPLDDSLGQFIRPEVQRIIFGRDKLLYNR